MRTVFYLLFFVTICGVAGVMLEGNRVLWRLSHESKPPVTLPSDDEGAFLPPPLPREPVSAPMAPIETVTQPDAPVDRRRARPKIDISSRQKVDAQGYNRVLKQFYPGESDPPDARLRVVMTVASDGHVAAARVEDSTFARPEFEAALIEEVKRMKYPDDDRYRDTEFSFEFSSTRPLPRRPVAEIDQQRDALVRRIDERRRALFTATSPPPGDAQLQIAYRVMPDGSVDEARVERSTFHSAAFARAVADEVRRLRFDPNPAYAPTDYTFDYRVAGSAAPGSARP